MTWNSAASESRDRMLIAAVWIISLGSVFLVGSATVGEARFPRTMDGWASPEYETATNRADIHLSGGWARSASPELWLTPRPVMFGMPLQ